jgi:hypothetical protein
MGSKVRCPILRHVKELFWSPTEMHRLISHFLRPSLTRSRDVCRDGQSALVVKLGVRHSQSRPPSLLPGDSTTGLRPQFWDGSLTPSQQRVYSLERVVAPNKCGDSSLKTGYSRFLLHLLVSSFIIVTLF